MPFASSSHSKSKPWLALAKSWLIWLQVITILNFSESTVMTKIKWTTRNDQSSMQKLFRFVPTISGAPVLCSEWEENQKDMANFERDTMFSMSQNSSNTEHCFYCLFKLQGWLSLCVRQHANKKITYSHPTLLSQVPVSYLSMDTAPSRGREKPVIQGIFNGVYTKKQYERNSGISVIAFARDSRNNLNWCLFFRERT